MLKSIVVGISTYIKMTDKPKFASDMSSYSHDNVSKPFEHFRIDIPARTLVNLVVTLRKLNPIHHVRYV